MYQKGRYVPAKGAIVTREGRYDASFWGPDALERPGQKGSKKQGKGSKKQGQGSKKQVSGQKHRPRAQGVKKTGGPMCFTLPETNIAPENRPPQ